jgi:group I intron endonuclease
MKKNNKNNPVVSEKFYPNSDTCKEKILDENKNKSGIYMWKNNLNKKRYIGSSKNLNRRFLEYFNVNYLLKNKSMYICCALLKHGYFNFSLTIIEYCEVSELLVREKYFWKFFKPEYNIAQDPTAPMSGRKHSDDTKIIMSEANKGKNHPNYGKTLPEETKKKISDTMVGNTNASNQPNSQSIEVTDITNNTTISYDSIHEAARALNCNESSIRYHLKSNSKKFYKGKYTFKKL